MPPERLRGERRKKAQPDEDALREIRDGRASPTIAFALENGSDEFSTLLREQIAEMDSDRRAHLKRVLEATRRAIAGNLQELEEVDSSSYRGLSGVIGLIIGGTLEAASGIGNLMIGGIASGLAVQQYLQHRSDEDRERIQQRLDRCILLVDALTTR